MELRRSITLLLIVYSIATLLVARAEDAPKKVGAGFLFITPDGSVLLLQRNSNNHDGAWSVPGGNADPSDGGSLLATAKREAAEELGGASALPAYALAPGSGSGILTRRGQFGSKHFTVFVARVAPATKLTYRAPNLDRAESRGYRWFSLREVEALIDDGLAHPVLKRLFRRHWQEVLAAAGISGGG